MADTYRSPWHADQVRSWCRETLANWAVPHQTHELDTTLGRTHVVSLGGGDGVCLYLPGTNFCASTSTVILETLATEFSVFTADLPGQPGLSASGRTRHEIAAYARWLEELVSWIRPQCRDRPLIVVGHSRGAAVALSADADSVDAIVLVSPAGLTSVRPTRQMLRATLPWLLRRDAAGARRLLQYMSGPGQSPEPALVDWMTLVARMCRTTGAPHPYPDAMVERWSGRRVVVVVGDHDVFFPAVRLQEASLRKLGTEPYVVADAGHLLADSDPQLITELATTLV